MSTFFQRLVRPTVHSILEALGEATNAASDRQPVFAQTTDFWTAFLGEIRDEPQGVRCWTQRARSDSPAIGLAWWTDPHGSRHFVVRGDSTGLGEMSHEPAFPPVWHLCPERIFRRERNSGTDWIALCDCGACGQPEAIGWAGDRCGDCHLGRTGPLRSGMVATLRDSILIDHLVFSPNNSLLAVAGQGRVHLWETGTRALRGQVERVFPGVQGLIFDHDGSRIGVAGGDRLLRWYDVETGEEKQSIPIPKDIVYLGLSNDGRVLVACGERDQEVWRRSESQWSLAFGLGDACEVAALSFDGRHLLVSNGQERRLYDLTVFLVEGWSRVNRIKPDWSRRDRVLAFNARGALSAYALTNTSQAEGAYSCQRIDALGGAVHWSANLRSLSSPRFNGEGLWLAGFDDEAIVLFPAYDCPLPIVLDPHVGRHTALAFAPDNETLAFASYDGTIRLWPWRRMVVA